MERDDACRGITESGEGGGAGYLLVLSYLQLVEGLK